MIPPRGPVPLLTRLSQVSDDRKRGVRRGSYNLREMRDEEGAVTVVAVERDRAGELGS